jgi:heavy metal translocating P-type ATPase
MSTTLDAPPRIGALARGERIALATRLTLACLAAGLLVLSLLWRWAFPSDAPLSELVAGAAALIVGVPVFAAGWQSLRAPSLHGITDRLIALALVGAWATGDLTTAALLPIVMIVGHVLEERSLIGSRDAIAALERLADTDSRRLHPDGHVELVPTSALRPGDLIELRAGDRLPVDGIVREGEASLDLASLTGESVPIDAAAGDPIASGAIDLDGRLVVEVTRVGRESTIGKIIALMQDAERAKPPVTRMLERHAGSYMAFVLTVTAATWFATGNGNATLAVLVASCPCALVLAAPATAIAAIAVAARHGILIKGTAFLENLADVTSIVFDKTGTLTTGALTLVAIEATPGVDGDTVLTLAASLAAGSSHPVSRAAARAARDGSPHATAIRETGGFGLTGQVAGREIAFGRPDLFSRLGIEAPQPPPHQGPIAGVSEAGVFAGWLLFADQVRPEAAAALADLRGLGLTRQMLLTGDRDIVAQRVAASLGITETESEALPERKMARVLAEIDAGWHPLVVGDGINDSLALRAGAVGVAMGAQGTDVALASADLVLLSSDLARLPTMIRLSRRCRRTIATNVGLGLGWTLVLMALAASGSLGAQGAVVAALLHNLSTFAGLANAGRLLLFDETQGSIKSAESSRIPSRNIDHPVTRA